MKIYTYLSLLLLAATSCNAPKTAHVAEPLRVGTLVASASNETRDATYVGGIEEEKAVALSFPLGGTLLRSAVHEGQYVSKGALLAELDRTSALQAFEASKATLDQAEDAYRRLKQLYDEESLPEIKWVEVNTRLSQARASYRLAEKNLEDCVIRAPFSGVIGKKSVEAGETVLPGVPVMTLFEIGEVKVHFSVPEQEISSISPESRIEVRVAALDNRLFTAEKPEKGVVADRMTHTYNVRAVIPNPDRALLPGMVCHVTVAPSTEADHEAEIVLPLSAVCRMGNGDPFVWVVRGDSVNRRAVTLGRLVDNGIVLNGGIEAGDRIVTEGIQKIGEGSKVVW